MKIVRPMTPLHRRMLEDMQIRNYSPHQYHRQLGRVDSMINPPEFSHLPHYLINKNAIGRFRKPF